MSPINHPISLRTLVDRTLQQVPGGELPEGAAVCVREAAFSVNGESVSTVEGTTCLVLCTPGAELMSLPASGSGIRSCRRS